VLNELLYADISQHSVAEKFRISQSMVSKWLKNKDVLFEQAATVNKKDLLKQQPSRKYLPLYNTLLTTFKEARSRGHQLTLTGSAWIRARIIYREQLADENITVKKHVIVSFLRWFNIRMRC